MTFFAKPSVAFAFGAFFLCAATCAHFDEIASTPLSLAPDWAAGILLVGGAVISGRDWGNGRAYQIAAWAFMVSLLFGSFLGNLEERVSQAPDSGTGGLVPMSEGTYFAIVTILFVFALGGLISSLQARDVPKSSS